MEGNKFYEQQAERIEGMYENKKKEIEAEIKSEITQGGVMYIKDVKEYNEVVEFYVNFLKDYIEFLSKATPQISEVSEEQRFEPEDLSPQEEDLKDVKEESKAEKRTWEEVPKEEQEEITKEAIRIIKKYGSKGWNSVAIRIAKLVGQTNRVKGGIPPHILSLYSHIPKDPESSEEPSESQFPKQNPEYSGNDNNHLDLTETF